VVEQYLVIDLHDVPAHEGTWTFVLPRAWAAGAFQDCEVEPTDEDGRVEVEVTQTGKDFLVRGKVRVVVAATCVRCLKPTPVVIDAPIAVLFVPGVKAAPAAAPLGDEDETEPDEGPDVEHFQGQQLVLDTYVRDTILLEVPMSPRCTVDCRLPEPPLGVS
jgi:uncharacterized protein